jgi:SAM-dependent methyltransferase
MARLFDSEEVARFENETWSRCAEGYTGGFGQLLGQGIGPLLDAAGVGAGHRVLDVGTGPGLVAREAAGRGAEPVGLDFSEQMLSEARRLHPGLEFRSGSAEALPFDDGEFDAVVGNFVLHHSGDPGRVLEEAFRVLRPGGRMAFTVWADPTKLEAFGLFFAAVEEHAGAAELPHGPLFGVSDFDAFHALARDAGFRDSQVRELDLAWETPTIDTFLAAFRDWANLDSFPEGARAAIESTVRQRAEDYRLGDVFSMPNPAILVAAGRPPG